MTIIHNPTTPLHLPKKAAVAIGMFDGVHMGHQELLKRLYHVAEENNAIPVVITYENHPTTVLRPDSPTSLLYPLKYRLQQIAKCGIAHSIVYTFDRAFSNQSSETFLRRVMEIVPFVYLNMGYDGRIGKNREGDKQTLLHLAQTLGFAVEYMPRYTFEGMDISSTIVRRCIVEGNLALANKLLGRRYGLFGHIVKGAERGAKIGFPTANIEIGTLVYPPTGVWIVKAKWDGKEYPAVANIGVAPTLNTERNVLLEVHIPGLSENLYGKSMEIQFFHYLRAEAKFDGVEALKEQLKKDVTASQEYFNTI